MELGQLTELCPVWGEAIWSTSRPGSKTSCTILTPSVVVGWLDAEDPGEALGRGDSIAVA